LSSCGQDDQNKSCHSAEVWSNVCGTWTWQR
jgi:hypothetical protein